MASLKLVIWNVRGVRDPIKRSAVFAQLKKQRADVVVLVETHAEGSVQKTLKRPWMGWAYHSVHTTHSRGVSILVTKTTHFELQGSETDPEGRYVFLKVKIHGDPILLLAYYVPPPFQFSTLTKGFDFMAMYPNTPAIWLGDFNTVLDPTLDRLAGSLSTTAPRHPTRFARLLDDFNLVDTWRYKHPTLRAYSCFSTSYVPHRSYSYIQNTTP